MTVGIAVAGGELGPPIVHGEDATNCPRIIAEEDPTESHEGSDGDGGP